MTMMARCSVGMRITFGSIKRRSMHGGVPVLHVQTRYTENEYTMAKDAVEVGLGDCARGRLRSAFDECGSEPARLQHS